MQTFEYNTSKHRVKNLKRLFIPLALFALAGIYLAWTFSHFELGYLFNLLQNSMLIVGPLALLIGASISLQFWLKAFKQKRLPRLQINDEYIMLLDGAVEERVYFANMDSIRLCKPGRRMESIQILLDSGQTINIGTDFPIESIKQYLNKTQRCTL
ncbi:MAG: hypothetical protein ACJA13_000260 [Paraglaciecola sp.]|jgi:hypothetical protein